MLLYKVLINLNTLTNPGEELMWTVMLDCEKVSKKIPHGVPTNPNTSI